MMDEIGVNFNYTNTFYEPKIEPKVEDIPTDKPLEFNPGEIDPATLKPKVQDTVDLSLEPSSKLTNAALSELPFLDALNQTAGPGQALTEDQKVVFNALQSEDQRAAFMEMDAAEREDFCAFIRGPSKEKAAAPAAPQAPYGVQGGDTLMSIAQQTLGDSNRWQEIYALNRDVIGADPNIILPGQQLKLPSAPAPAAAPVAAPAASEKFAKAYGLAAASAASQPSAAAPAANQLSTMSSAELANLGANDKAAFFAALRPAAEAAEQQYGVPAEVTLAQAALESNWGKDAIGEYNIFGIKGSGPAGTMELPTQEWDGSGYVSITDNFAVYNNFNEAVVEHGQLFHNGCYDTAVNQFAQDKDYVNFVNNIQGIYATDPEYSAKIFSLVDEYGLANPAPAPTPAPAPAPAAAPAPAPTDALIPMEDGQPAVMRKGMRIGASLAAQFDAMDAAAKAAGIDLQITSGYRTHAEQQAEWDANPTPGEVAYPGTSNHETGNAIDFADTPGAWDWLAQHASEYGLHNYAPEAWHYSVDGG